jgi:hypothetical protein
MSQTRSSLTPGESPRFKSDGNRFSYSEAFQYSRTSLYTLTEFLNLGLVDAPDTRLTGSTTRARRRTPTHKIRPSLRLATRAIARGLTN